MDFVKVYDDGAVHAASLLVHQVTGSAADVRNATGDIKSDAFKSGVTGAAPPFLTRTLTHTPGAIPKTLRIQHRAGSSLGDAICFPPPKSPRSKIPNSSQSRKQVDLLFRLFRHRPSQCHDAVTSPRRSQRGRDPVNYEELSLDVPPEWIDTSSLISLTSDGRSSRKRHRLPDYEEDYLGTFLTETSVPDDGNQKSEKAYAATVKDGEENEIVSEMPPSHMQTRSAAAASIPPQPVSFYYCYASPDGTGALLVEKRKDGTCPFCARQVSTEADLLTHLTLIHGDCFTFQSTKDRQSHLHVSVHCGFDTKSEKKPRKPSQLKDFVHVRSANERHQRISGVPNHDSASDVHSLRNDSSVDAPLPYGSVPPEDKSGGRTSFLPVRQYFHSRTNLPMLDGDWDQDSDDEPDDGWLHRLGDKLLDDFDDVSKKEKEFMKLWNRYIKSHTITPDRAVPDKCVLFVSKHVQQLAKHGLRQQLLLHLLNLWDFGVLSSDHILQCMGQYDGAVQNSQQKE